MFFRNLTLFRFPTALASMLEPQEASEGGSFEMRPSVLDQGLAECALKPVGPLELYSRGFIPPMGQHSEALSHRIGNAIWITVGGEDKILPSAVVNDLLAKKIAEIEEREGCKVGGRARKRLKEGLVTQLLPRAFVRPRRVDAILDLEHGYIAVDTSSRRVGEEVVSEIRRALGSFPALPLNAEIAPRAVLTGWVAGDALLDGLSIGDECELRDPTDSGAKVRCTRQELHGDEIAKHLEAGKQVTRLALTLDDHVSFVLGEDLVVRKFKLLDGAVEALESEEREDVVAELDARFALMSGELRTLFVVLERALKLSKADT